MHANNTVGDGTLINRAYPSPIVDPNGILRGRTIVSIVAGASHTLLLTYDGRVIVYCANAFGQLGLGSLSEASPIPLEVNTTGALAGKIVRFAFAGQYHSLLLTYDNVVYASGKNTYGQLGIGSITDTSLFTPVNSSETGSKIIVSLAAGLYHSILLASDGTLFVTGEINANTGYNSTVTNFLYPRPIIAGVLAGKNITAVFGSGSNRHALLLFGTTPIDPHPPIPLTTTAGPTTSPAPTVQPTPTPSPAVSPPSSSSTQQYIYGMGSNLYGQAGIGYYSESPFPLEISSRTALFNKTVTYIKASEKASFAFTSDGILYGWVRIFTKS